MSEQGKYIYGVINSSEKKDFGRTGRDGKEVYTIPCQDISCVVSDSDGLNLAMMEKEELGRYLVDHQAVIEEVMKEHTIIPIKFGTEVEKVDDVKKILERGYSEFRDRLKDLDGKMELDVAPYWPDLNKTIRAIGEEDEEIRTFKEEIAKKPPQDTFSDRLKIGSMISTALEKKRNQMAKEILDFLRQTAIDSQRHEVMDEKIILSCAFLLEKERETDFDQALDELNKRYDETVNFKCVGPLPAYSFATYEVKRIGYDQINEARNLLDLGEETTADEIKDSYRKKTLDCHPDKDPDNPALGEKFEQITKGYKLLLSFCQGEKCSFTPNEVEDFFLIETMRI